MKIGMLWFDNDPHTDLSAKVERAATYYRLKYGKSPTVCFVHPSMLPAAHVEQPHESEHLPAVEGPRRESESIPPGFASGNQESGRSAPASKNGRKTTKKPPAVNASQATGVEVRSNPSVRPHHFWIGVNGASPVSSTTSTSNEISAGMSPDLTLSSASSSR